MLQPAVSQPPRPTNSAAAPCAEPQGQELRVHPDPVLCQHCGRTASNGISCEGACVADSGY
jgi:hypothetical protein